MTSPAFVLDNSVVLAWGLSEGEAYADRVMDLLADGEALVPEVWPLEFANALVVAERRKRLAAAEASRLRDLIQALPIRVVPATAARVLGEQLALARRYELSVYDASYLDLAIREGVALATLDEPLRRAAGKAKVPLAAAAHGKQGR